MHTCKYSYQHRVCTARKPIQGHSQTQNWLRLNLFRTICCFWSKLYWTNSVYLAHTLFILCNNNMTVPGGSCSQCSGAANVGWTRQGLEFFSCTLMWCLRFTFILRRESATSTPCSIVNMVLFPEGSAAGWNVSFEEDCLSVWRATHAIHIQMAPQIIWPCWEPTEIKLRVLIIFMFLSFLIYFTIAHWLFIMRAVQNSHAMNNIYQTTMSNIQEQSEG